MRSAQVSELKERLEEVIEAVKHGETVEIWEGDTVVADMAPPITKSGLMSSTHGPKALVKSVMSERGSYTEERTTETSVVELPDQTALKAHLDDLVRQGKARRGTGTLPPDFLTRPLPKAKKSVLEALLEDRHSD